jgi:transposase
MRLYIGLDVHSKLTVYCAQNEKGEVMEESEVATSRVGLAQMLGRLGAAPGTAVALESGTQAGWVCGLLAEQGMAPVVIDAREVRAKARNKRQKSDRRDAFEICDGLRRDMWVSRVWVPTPTIERLRGILSRRRHFVGLRTAQINAAKFLLRRRGLSGLCRSLKTEKAWQRLLGEVGPLGLSAHLELHHGVWLQAQAACGQLEEELLMAAQPLAGTLDLLQSLEGIGPIVAAAYVATLGTPQRFADAGHVIGYVGLAVSTYDSGQRERHGHITRAGNGYLRALLCEAAHHAARPGHPLHPYFARLAARRGVKPAVIAVAQRLARILFQMWRTNQRFDAGRLNVRPVRKTYTREIYWEIPKPAAAPGRAA